MEVQMQPSVDNQLEGSYITEAQVMQVENVSGHTSISNLDLVMYKYLKNQFNELLNDNIYNTFKELFGGINIDIMKEALPKVSIYSDTTAQFVEEINSKYGMTLTFTCLEPCEVGHWAETFQVASGNSKGPQPTRPQQVCEEPHRAEQLQPLQQQSQPVTEQPQQLQPVTEQPQQPALQPQPTLADPQPTPPQVQVQQKEISRLTNMAQQWSAGYQHQVDNPYNTHRHWYTCKRSTPNMSPIVPDYNNHRYYDNQGWQGSNFLKGRYLNRECFLTPHTVAIMLITLISYTS